jgi:hypothetical protein
MTDVHSFFTRGRLACWDLGSGIGYEAENEQMMEPFSLAAFIPLNHDIINTDPSTATICINFFTNTECRLRIATYKISIACKPVNDNVRYQITSVGVSSVKVIVSIVLGMQVWPGFQKRCQSVTKISRTSAQGRKFG